MFPNSSQSLSNCLLAECRVPIFRQRPPQSGSEASFAYGNVPPSKRVATSPLNLVQPRFDSLRATSLYIIGSWCRKRDCSLNGDWSAGAGAVHFDPHRQGESLVLEYHRCYREGVLCVYHRFGQVVAFRLSTLAAMGEVAVYLPRRLRPRSRGIFAIIPLCFLCQPMPA